MLLPALQDAVKSMGLSVQKGYSGKRPGLKYHVSSTCVQSQLSIEGRSSGLDVNSMLDCSAAHRRELNAGQTQPETRRTFGDVKAPGDGKAVLSPSNNGSAQAAGNASQVIRVVLVLLSRLQTSSGHRQGRVHVPNGAVTTWWSVSRSLKLSRGGPRASYSSEQLSCRWRYWSPNSR